MRRSLPMLLAWGMLAAMLAPHSAPATPPEFSVASPFIRDALGRAVFFHGVNMIWKRPPYYPPSALYGSPLSGSYLDERDAAWMAENGLSTVRLGVLWAGEEPTEGGFGGAYLDRIEDIVDMFAAYGIAVMLDMHQDMFNERFQGQGFPPWATHTEAHEFDEEAQATAPPDGMARSGFPVNYFTPPVMRAFDNLWTNHAGLWDEFAAFWRRVAVRFKDKPNVIGYDLLNEPWPGSQWESCANPGGCPAFDVAFLQPFFEHAAREIRAVDPTRIIWWEPNVTNDFGAADNVGLAHSVESSMGANGISFHPYCLLGGQFVPGLSRADDPECPFAEDLTYRQQMLAAQRNSSSLFVTEFGASDDLVDIARVANLADQYMVSWHYWHYGSWADPTGNPQQEGMFADDLDRPGSLKQPKASVLIRPYPRAIAGTPAGWHFDAVSKAFTLDYTADGTIGAPTLIFVPVARHYGGHYTTTVSGPVTVTSAADSAFVTLQNIGGGPVHVRIAPL